MLRDSVLQKQEEIGESKYEMVVHELSSFCPSDEKAGIGGPTNKEAGVRADVTSSTFKQFLLEAWLIKGKALILKIWPETLNLGLSMVLF